MIKQWTAGLLGMLTALLMAAAAPSATGSSYVRCSGPGDVVRLNGSCVTARNAYTSYPVACRRIRVCRRLEGLTCRHVTSRRIRCASSHVMPVQVYRFTTARVVP